MTTTKSTTLMSTLPGRRGHAAIGAMIEEMGPYLPSETINKPGYRQCRTTYGLLATFHRRAEESNEPKNEYKELQQTEADLRRRLNSLNATKGVPQQMLQLLDELKGALDDAVLKGVTVDFIIQGLIDILQDAPDAQPVLRPERFKMIPDTQYKEAKAGLAAANEKIKRLNEENNLLAMKVKQLEIAGGRVGTIIQPATEVKQAKWIDQDYGREAKSECGKHI
ncbi:hypothetical protein BKA66DRAFT_515675 [Pyrenochaeta sp. MPI-SDFR-AT-0127]|nr:hypothetical protein BKA66DRAFT_515675 [Pyrenochaeta sp. MPI-SDFR-AT-0127]